jgi:Protein of unknown function (DUF2891)
MMSKKIFLLFLISNFFLSACTGKKEQMDTPTKPLTITKEMAETLAKLPLKCAQKEFPNKINQTLTDAGEIGLPKSLHPAFYGCFDWHSSVHGHWMLVKLLHMYPDLSTGDEIRRLLKSNISPENIAIETDYFLRKSEKSFERTYGWAWLLKLHEAILDWDDPLAAELSVNLQPLTNLMVNRYMEFLPKLLYPIRSGEHPNTAFGLALAYDYAKKAKNDTLVNLITQRSRDFFMSDEGCPIKWEPGGFDFLSPCLQEADLMARVLDPAAFKTWLNKFLPELSNHDYQLKEAKVSDRSDGKLVHLDGVNFCRAWSMYQIAEVIPEYNHLIKIANNHVEASLPNIVDGGYEGEHWLASFAIYTLK